MKTTERMINLGYQMLTRTQRSFWEVTSVMQNAIRNGDYELAGYGMWELLPRYTPYLRKRLLVISAEDCFGVITKEILALSEIGTEEALSKALSLLCKAKKNRDADYFACNLMYADGNDKIIVNSGQQSLFGEEQSHEATKEELASMLMSSIENVDVIKTGKLSFELFKKNRKYLWDTLLDIVKTHYPHLAPEVAALRKSNDLVSKPSEETIFAAKAIVLMWTCKQPKERLLAVDSIDFNATMQYEKIPIIKPLEQCKQIRGLFPEWAYNWHTSYGKYKLRRDAVHAITNDQRLLNPLEENLFDDCTWNRDINACLLQYNPNNYHLPYNDGKITPSEKFKPWKN